MDGLRTFTTSTVVSLDVTKFKGVTLVLSPLLLSLATSVSIFFSTTIGATCVEVLGGVDVAVSLGRIVGVDMFVMIGETILGILNGMGIEAVGVGEVCCSAEIAGGDGVENDAT